MSLSVGKYILLLSSLAFGDCAYSSRSSFIDGKIIELKNQGAVLNWSDNNNDCRADIISLEWRMSTSSWQKQKKYRFVDSNADGIWDFSVVYSFPTKKEQYWRDAHVTCYPLPAEQLPYLHCGATEPTLSTHDFLDEIVLCDGKKP